MEEQIIPADIYGEIKDLTAIFGNHSYNHLTEEDRKKISVGDVELGWGDFLHPEVFKGFSPETLMAISVGFHDDGHVFAGYFVHFVLTSEGHMLTFPDKVRGGIRSVPLKRGHILVHHACVPHALEIAQQWSVDFPPIFRSVSFQCKDVDSIHELFDITNRSFPAANLESKLTFN